MTSDVTTMCENQDKNILLNRRSPCGSLYWEFCLGAWSLAR